MEHKLYMLEYGVLLGKDDKEYNQYNMILEGTESYFNYNNAFISEQNSSLTEALRIAHGELEQEGEYAFILDYGTEREFTEEELDELEGTYDLMFDFPIVFRAKVENGKIVEF